jgi:S1-C subfamily serine protease
LGGYRAVAAKSKVTRNQSQAVSMSILSDLSNDAAALAEQVAPRVVAVEGAKGRISSGFIWRSGLVVTAEEVLEGEEEVTLHLNGGRTLKATLAGRDPSTDVALLRAETEAFDDWPVADAVKPAAFVLVAGRGANSALATLAGVSEVGPAWRSMRGGTIDANITLGLRLTGRSEGAAVVAPDGRLVGMAVSSPRRRALVIPASTIARAVGTLSEKGYVPRGWLGVMLHPVGGGSGAIVLAVEDNSPAAGRLLVGDVITTWEGETIGSVGSLAQRLVGSAAGSKVKLGVTRGGQAHDIDVTLGERPRG